MTEITWKLLQQLLEHLPVNFLAWFASLPITLGRCWDTFPPHGLVNAICPHRFRCVAQWPHQKMHFGFSVSMRRLTKVQTTSEHCCCCRACNLKVWCNSALLCFSYAMESVEPKRNKRRVQLSSCIFCVALSLSLSFFVQNSRKKNHIYPVISFMMISHDIIHDNKHQRFRL